MKSLLCSLALGALGLAAALPAAAADRALLIGIDAYADPALAKPAFNAAKRDVDALRRMIEGKLGYPEAGVGLLMDGEATRDGILAALDKLEADTAPGDRVLIYYAGLGTAVPDTDGDEADKLDEAFVPSDAKVVVGDEPAIDNVVTDDEVFARLAKLEGRRITLVADTSFSGKVTRKGGPDAAIAARIPQIDGKTRAIKIVGKVAAQKEEVSFVDKLPEGLDISVYGAAAATQMALLDSDDPGAARGVFTKLLVDAIESGSADANGNGSLSNAELLDVLRKGSAAACEEMRKTCELGLTPTLAPDRAFASLAFGGAAGAAETSAVVTKDEPAPAEPEKVPGKTAVVDTGPVPGITLDKVLDLIGAAPDGRLKLDIVGSRPGSLVKGEALPDGEVPLGTRNIRFRVTSDAPGYLLLFTVSKSGEITHLFPNEHSKARNKDGLIPERVPVTVPDAYYGFSIDADEAEEGSLVAIVARDPIVLPEAIKTRAIKIVAKAEAAETYLPTIAAAVGGAVKAEVAEANTKAVDRSVAVIGYRIGAGQ